MNCPYCNHNETKVTDSRESKDGTLIKRRRECNGCEKRFSTIEKILKLDLEVLKQNGDVQEFNFEKIRKSLIKSCEKRPITLEHIENILEEILEKIKKIEEDTIPTSKIGKVVLDVLKKNDEIAFLKYAIVHKKYNSMNMFVKELNSLKSFKGIEY